MPTKQFEKRFGMMAVEKGFVTPEQVLKAIEIQIKENIEQKKHRFIGTVLVDQWIFPKGLSEKSDVTIFMWDSFSEKAGMHYVFHRDG